MLEAKQSRLLRYQLARCYSMAASLKQVNKTSLGSGDYNTFTHTQDKPFKFKVSGVKVTWHCDLGVRFKVQRYTKLLQLDREECVFVVSPAGISPCCDAT